MTGPSAVGYLELDRWQKTGFVVAAVAAACCVAGAISGREPFLQSYLFAFMLWFSMGIGCLGLLLIHHITGGAWGDLIRPMLEAGTGTLPWLGLLFLPIFFGVSSLYPWAHPSLAGADALLRHKAIYLNVGFFRARAIAAFLIWGWMASWLDRLADQEDPRAVEKAARRSAPGLFVYFLTVTFCLIDWTMSLEPHWYSTMYAGMVMSGQALGAMALMACGLVFFGDTERMRDDLPPKPFLDLGNMLLVCVMFWAYVSFSQYLIIWSGNIPEEIAWYLRRQRGGWFEVEMALIVFQFVLPFLFLLGRANKERVKRLVWIAGLILILRCVETYWLVKPAFASSGPRVHWTDAAAFFAVGGAWIAAFLGGLKSKPSAIGVYLEEEPS